MLRHAAQPDPAHGVSPTTPADLHARQQGAPGRGIRPSVAPGRDNGIVPTFRDEVVILRTHKLGEADRILTMLSRRNGKLRAVAKGVRRTSSRFGSRLEPFMVADVLLYQGRTLDIVQQAESLGSYGADIAIHYDRYTSAHAMVEAADRLNEAEATPQQYLLLVGGLRALAQGEHSSRSVLDSYLLRAMALSGWAPGLAECARCGKPGPHDSFVAQLGGMICADCAPTGAPRVAPPTVSLLQSLMAGEWDDVDAAAPASSAAASGLIAAYAQWHLERGIRSLAHVSTGDPR
ncbi:DNA repair protein RecO [Microbacterium aoyamense]|uniref:DNA repair protein RecO n=1 Tax=Microbacterium aoyamense TaxID=344166 RepID=A0ABN2P5N5_9MICO